MGIWVLTADYSKNFCFNLIIYFSWIICQIILFGQY